MGYGTQTFDIKCSAEEKKRGREEGKEGGKKRTEGRTEGGTKGGREDRYRYQLLTRSTINVTMPHTKVPWLHRWKVSAIVSSESTMSYFAYNTGHVAV